MQFSFDFSDVERRTTARTHGSSMLNDAEVFPQCFLQLISSATLAEPSPVLRSSFSHALVYPPRPHSLKHSEFMHHPFPYGINTVRIAGTVPGTGEGGFPTL